MNKSEPPKMIVIAGPNGAGKSTLAPFLLRDAFGLLEYVNADTIAQGLSAFQPEAAAFEAGRIMLKRLHQLAGQRLTFAFESTLAGRAYATWFERLRREGYEINILFLWLHAPELAVERVKERVRRGGHDVPEDVIRRRYAHGLRNFFHVYRPLADTWGVYDNSSTLRPVLLATGRRDEEDRAHDAQGWQRFLEHTR